MIVKEAKYKFIIHLNAKTFVCRDAIWEPCIGRALLSFGDSIHSVICGLRLTNSVWRTLKEACRFYMAISVCEFAIQYKIVSSTYK